MKKEDLLQPAVVVLLTLEFILIVLICLYWWKLLEFSWQVFEKLAGQVTWSNWFMKFFEVDQVRAGMFLFGASMSIGSIVIYDHFLFYRVFCQSKFAEIKMVCTSGKHFDNFFDTIIDVRSIATCIHDSCCLRRMDSDLC